MSAEQPFAEDDMTKERFPISPKLPHAAYFCIHPLALPLPRGDGGERKAISASGKSHFLVRSPSSPFSMIDRAAIPFPLSKSVSRASHPRSYTLHFGLSPAKLLYCVHRDLRASKHCKFTLWKVGKVEKTAMGQHPAQKGEGAWEANDGRQHKRGIKMNVSHAKDLRA